MRKFFSYLLSPFFIFSFGILLVIFDPIQRISFRLLGYQAHKKVVDVLNYFLQGTQYILCNSVSFTFEQELPLGVPIIFCANHQSMYDISAMIWYLRKFHAKFISKIELTKGIPSISYNLRAGGGANIDRKDNKQALVEIMKLGKKMKAQGWSTVIFPEGTRSKDGKLKTFQFGGVSALLKTCPEALIVPIAIENSWKIVRFGKFPFGVGLSLRWQVLKPIAKEGLSPEQIVQQVENIIKAKVEK